MIIVSVILLFVVVTGFVFIRRNTNTLKRLEEDIESRVDMEMDKRIHDIETMHERIANDKEEIDALTQEIKDIHSNISVQQRHAKLGSKDEMRIESAEQAVKALRKDIQQSRTHVDRILSRQSELNRTINNMKRYVEGAVSRVDNQIRAVERMASIYSPADSVIMQNRRRLDALEKAGEGRSKQITYNAKRIASEAGRIRRNARDVKSTAANVKRQIGAVRKAIDLNKTTVRDVREAAEQNKAGVLKALKDLSTHQIALNANADRIDTNKGGVDANTRALQTVQTTVDAIANRTPYANSQKAIIGVQSKMQSSFEALQNDVTRMSYTVSSNQGSVKNLWTIVENNQKGSTDALKDHTDSINKKYAETMHKMDGDKKKILDQLDVLKESFEGALATMSTNNKTVIANIYDTINDMTKSLNTTTDNGILEIKASMESKNDDIVSRITDLTDNILPKTKVDISDELKRESVDQMQIFKSEINAKMTELRRLVETAREDTVDTNIDEERGSDATANDDEEEEDINAKMMTELRRLVEAADDTNIDEEEDINAPIESRLTIIG